MPGYIPSEPEIKTSVTLFQHTFWMLWGLTTCSLFALYTGIKHKIKLWKVIGIAFSLLLLLLILMLLYFAQTDLLRNVAWFYNRN